MGRQILMALLLAATLSCGTTCASVASAASGSVSATSRCKLVISGTHWTIEGVGSGSRYTLAAEGMSCAAAKPWAVKLMQRRASQTMQGPKGFKCHSFATAASGDTLDYSGVCLHAPGVPFFEWGPKP
jgi:hypothetical protein